MARRLPAALCCFSCCLGLAAAFAAADTAPPAHALVSPLEDGGQKLANNDIQGAIHSLQSVVQTQPGNTDALHLLTVAYLHSGQFLQAAETTEVCLRQPTLERDSRAINALLLGKARYSAFSEELKKCSAHTDSLVNMRQLMSQMAVHQYQLPSGDILVEHGDDSAAADYNDMRASLQGRLSRLQELLSKAEAAYMEALADDPNLAGIHDGLGVIRAAQGYTGEAQIEFHSELRLYGASSTVYAHLGELDASEGREEDAIENLRLAISLTPQFQAPFADLVLLYQKKHDDEHVQWAKGMLALLKGDQSAAETILSSRAPRTADLLCGQAQLALAQKRWDDARRLLTQARDKEPQNARIVSALGDVEEAHGHHTDAIRLYKQALALEPLCDAAWYGIGLAYDGQSDRDSALADYKQAVLSNPNNPLAELNLAADEADLGQFTQAALSLHDYLRRFPTAGNIYVVQSMLTRLEAK